MRPIHGLIAGLVAATAGCSWTTYDDLKDDLTVDVSEGPSDPGTVYGIELAAPGVRPTSPGASLAVLGRSKPTLTRMAFAADGTRDEEQTGALESVSIEQFSLRPALAADPGSTWVGFVGLTNSNDTTVVLYDLANLDQRRSIVYQNAAEQGESTLNESEGLAFASLRTRPQATEEGVDVVFSRRDDVVLIDDPRTENAPGDAVVDRTYACTHGGKWSYAIGVGDVLSTLAGPEIVVSVASAERSGTAEIKLIDPASLTAALPPVGTPAPPCAFLTADTIVPDGNLGRDYGDEIVVADLDGDGRAEIVTSAPNENRVFVIRENPDAPGTFEQSVLEGDGDLFGESLAVGDLVGDDGALEVVVGAPRVNVGGASNAGAVTVHAYDGATGELDATPRAVFHDANPDTEQAYGSAVAVVPWGSDPMQNLLVVSAKDEVFTYFQAFQDRADVRARR